MAKYVGLDWASKGWFGVILNDSGTWETDLFPSLWSVWKYHSDASRILIDIPIGLPSDEKRACDVNAKEKLAHRQRSVFYTPVRDAVYEQNLDEAKETNEAEADFSIQNQAWSLVSRIREVDEFLDMYPSARDRVQETHPEVCFYALNGRNALTESKRTEEGVTRLKNRTVATWFYRYCEEKGVPGNDNATIYTGRGQCKIQRPEAVSSGATTRST